ncbi:hypothetical protein HDU89_003309 [Geranomyces variabilis]|nr:hypothetical protein HDU89_003309 [Geranomyces variabilis]
MPTPRSSSISLASSPSASASSASLSGSQPSAAVPPPTYVKSARPHRSYLALKRLQYEYTFGVFMMEPWEKAIFDTVVVMFAVLCGYAIWIYAPEAAHNLVHKATYYISTPESF